jgi:tetratricopeptide (TPR) repeat protein
MPLALFGLMISFGRWRERLPLYAVVIAYFAEASIFFVLARYRMPAVPVLMLFAAHGGLSIWDYLRAREWRMLATSGYTVAALAWLVNWNIASPNLHSAWFGMGVRYQELDRLDAAVDSYGRCLAIYEDHVQARYNLAIAYEGMGRHDAAVDAWRAVHDWARRNGHAVYLRESEARLLALGAGPS